jgi:HlyD family secretion protein
MTAVVSTTTISKTLYYSGTIKPIENVPVISPTSGVVDKLNFNYGQIVKKGRLLVHIKSDKLLDSLRSAQVAYLNALQAFIKVKDWGNSNDVINARNGVLRAKRTLNQAKITFEQNKTLYHKYGIISLETLNQSQAAYADATAADAQTDRTLVDVLKRGTGDHFTVVELQLNNAEEKYDSLKKQVRQRNIYAPAAGIVLAPSYDNTSGGNSSSGSSSSSSSSSSSTGGTTSGKLAVGQTLQYQEVLMNIGNLQGLKLDFQVPEVNINAIKAGEKAIVTGSAFPGIILTGKVQSVGAQAASGGGSLPTFPVNVIVPKISKAGRHLIRSGMDAKIAITIYKKSKKLAVPVQAVHQKTKDKKVTQYVVVYNPKTEKTKEQTVTTGKLTVKYVEILSGLKKGELVVVPKTIPAPKTKK